jgi:hypothetical protein
VCLIRNHASQTTDHQVDHHDLDDRFTGLRPQLIILAQPPVTIEPAQRALHDPAFGAHQKALDNGRALDDVQPHRPIAPQRLDPSDQRAGIGLISPNPAQARKFVPEDRKDVLRTVTVLHTGRRDDDGQAQPKRVNEDMALAAVDVFVGVKAPEPPFSVVFTDWLSMRPARGWRRLPAATRTSPRRRSCIRCQVPSFRQRQQYW